MSNVRFIGCLHLGHEAIAKHRGFNGSYEHDNHLIDMWNRIVHKKDTTYILGDITMEKSKYYYMLDQLAGRKIVVLGNHDRYQDIPHLMNHVDGIAGVVDYKGCILTHVPIHPNEVQFYRKNIHAHIHHVNKLEEVIVSDSYLDEGHQNKPSLHKYYCVDADLINYKPLLLDQIL